MYFGFPQNQNEWISHLNQMLSYIAAKQNINSLTDISFELPIEHSISISSKLEKEIVHLRNANTKKVDGYHKKDKKIQQEMETVKRELKDSPLLAQVNTIMAKYKMKVYDIRIIEPTLLCSKREFVEHFCQYKYDDLPKYILGFHISLNIKSLE